MGPNTLLKPSYMCLFAGGGQRKRNSEKRITMCHCRYQLESELLHHHCDAEGGVLGDASAGLPPGGQPGGRGAGLYGGQLRVDLVGGLGVIGLGAAPVQEGEGARDHGEDSQQDADYVDGRLHLRGDIYAKQIEVCGLTGHYGVGRVPDHSKEHDGHLLVLEESSNFPGHISDSHDDHNKTEGLIPSLAHALVVVETYNNPSIRSISCLHSQRQRHYSKHLDNQSRPGQV